MLIDNGIPISRAEFKAAVSNSDKVPEMFFDEASEKSSRRVKMLWTPTGLICEHKEKWFIVPTDMVKFSNVK
jgi:hypothetical protein